MNENESARVEKNDGGQGGSNRVVVLVQSAKPAGFVRGIPKQTVKVLDLVDVVAGGDGFSGRRNRGIDPTDGRVATSGIRRYLTSVGKYHRVEAIPFVDGVFIPPGGFGPVQLDSAGHTFAEFGNANNLTANHIWAGGKIPTTPPNAIPTEMGGIDYASPGHGLLFLHSNKGLTFDLDAIRQANPGCRPMRFRAVAGNTEKISAKGGTVYAALWVLVDGQVRFQAPRDQQFHWRNAHQHSDR